MDERGSVFPGARHKGMLADLAKSSTDMYSSSS